MINLENLNIILTGATGAAGDNATIAIGTITTLPEDSNLRPYPLTLVEELAPIFTLPDESIRTFSAAASEDAVLKINEVAFELDEKSVSEIASIPAATKMASVPVPSSGA